MCTLLVNDPDQHVNKINTSKGKRKQKLVNYPIPTLSGTSGSKRDGIQRGLEPFLGREENCLTLVLICSEIELRTSCLSIRLKHM